MFVRLVLAAVFIPFFATCNAIDWQVRLDNLNDSGNSEVTDSVNDNSANDNSSISPAGLPTGTVTIGDDTINVEIADTFATRQHGLMDRNTLDADAGMLFIFDGPQFLSFWMLNTLIPLDIAFIREDLVVSSTDTMQPLTTTYHDSIEPVLYALEVPAGELSRRQIGPGDVVSILRNK
ncbi:MAG: DUF192 domain-containing protein [Phycisphaerales bacterium]|nr:MAG: DUF192 domain-containing protein [Phycisphaerales bacterium]